tara:strand:- start:1140 stop:1463 length:324 start_codon:yes stop_codon:yes gene_type:complete
MNTFDERKKGFEAKFLKDEETQFKIRAKRNKHLGIWAAEIYKPENVEEYIKEVRLSDLEEPGDEDIIKKLLKDFDKKSINISREEIIKKIEECYQKAVNEFMDDSNI